MSASRSNSTAAITWREAGIRAVAVDLDGTMVDTAPDFHVAINAMLSALDRPQASLQTVVDSVGKGTDHLIRGILGARLQGDSLEAQFAKARALYLDHYRAINGRHSRIYPGVVEGLAAMKDMGLRMACVTNKPYEFARGLLDCTGLGRWFEVVYGGDSLPRRKPDPLPLLQVARDFSVAPAAMLAIGDSSNDAMAARAAGCKVMVLPYGYNHGLPVQTIEADGIVGSLMEAAELLASAPPHRSR